MYTQVRLARPYRHGPFTIDCLEFCVGCRNERATALHVRGRCDGDVPFAGCLVLAEGRRGPERDVKTYCQPRDTDALAAAIEACLADETPVVHDEMNRIRG